METLEELKDAFEKHCESDKDSFGSIQDSLKRIEETLRTQNDTLKPISETYTSASMVGKWLMAISVFISLAIGVIIGLKDLLKH